MDNNGLTIKHIGTSWDITDVVNQIKSNPHITGHGWVLTININNVGLLWLIIGFTTSHLTKWANMKAYLSKIMDDGISVIWMHIKKNLIIKHWDLMGQNGVSLY